MAFTQMLAGFEGLGKTLAPRGPRRQAATVRTVITAQQRPPTLAGMGDSSDWVSAINTASSGVSQVANALQPKQAVYVAPASSNMPLYLILGGVGLLGVVGIMMAMKK